MTEYISWRIFVLTLIGLFFTTLCILDACIRSYWIRKQRRAQIVTSQYRIQQLPRSILERENPRPYYRPRPFHWS